MTGGHPNGWMVEVRALSRRVWLVRRGYWFPMLVFGVLVLASLPFFGPLTVGGDVGSKTVIYHETAGLVGGGDTTHPGELAAFWLVGVPVAYLVTAGFYWARARRRGVGVSPKGFVAVGICLVALLGALSAAGLALPPGDGAERGLLPLVTFGVGFLVLAHAERSWGLGAFAVVLLALSVFVNVGSVPDWIVEHRPSWLFEHHLAYHIDQIEPFAVGTLLVLGGVAAGLVLAARKRKFA